MSTRLTHAAASAKQFGLAMLFVIPLLILGRVAWGVIADATRPKPTPTPTYVNPEYGILPRLKIPTDTKRSDQVQIQLNTTNLQVPTPNYFGTTVPVMKYRKRTTNFDYINNVNQIARIFNITTGTNSQVSPIVFRISEPSTDGAQMDIDIQYYHIQYRYKNPTAYIPIERGGTVDGTSAYNSATNLRNSLQVYLEPAATTPFQQKPPEKPYEVSFAYRNLDGTIRKVTDKLQANITEIKLARNLLNDIPFVSPSTVDPNMKFTYTEERATVSSGGANRPRLIQADIIYFPVDETSAAQNVVYPIKPIEQAYAELTQGKGYILSPTEPNVTYLILRSYLAFYEPREFMEYVTPVWVFEGDTVNDPNFLFRAITPAIATGWIEE